MSNTWMPPHKVRPQDLTEREIQVLSYLADGLSNEAIGRKLFLAEDTIKTHLRRLYRKFGVDSRVEAVVEGMKRGIIRCACERKIDERILEAVKHAVDSKEREIQERNNRAP